MSAHPPAVVARRALIVAAAVFGVAVGPMQQVLHLGLTPEEFAAKGDDLLRVAPFAFAIWGLLYAGVLMYAGYQVLEQTRETTLLKRLGWYSLPALIGIGTWVIASAAGYLPSTLGIILVSGFSLLIPLIDQARAIRALPFTDPVRRFVVWPLAALAGWLTVASGANFMLVADSTNLQLRGMPYDTLSFVAIGVVGLIALSVTFRTRLMAYPLPVAWGLFGVYWAEQARNPDLAMAAATSSVVLAAAGVMVALLPEGEPYRAMRVDTRSDPWN